MFKVKPNVLVIARNNYFENSLMKDILEYNFGNKYKKFYNKMHLFYLNKNMNNISYLRHRKYIIPIVSEKEYNRIISNIGIRNIIYLKDIVFKMKLKTLKNVK